MDTGTIVWAELNIRSQPLQVIQRLDPFLLSSDVFESATALALTAAAWTSARDLAKGEEYACQVLQKLKNSPADVKSAKALGRAYLVLAEVNHDRGDADACVRYMLLCRQQLEVSLSPGLQGGLHLLEAAVARKKGDLDAVRSALESALMAFDEAGDRAAVAGTMNNLAVFHREQGNNADALRLHIESATISRAMEDWINVARNEYNQALLLRSSADFEGALALMESSLAVMKNLGEVRGEAHVLNGLGSLHLDLKQFEQARFCFQKSLAIKQNLKLVNDQAVAWVNLAQTCQGAGNWEEADSALNHAYQLTLETGNAHLRWSIYLGFALQAVQAQDAKGALENFSEALNQTQQLGQQNEALECAEAFYNWVLDRDPIVFKQLDFQGSCATLLQRLEPSQIELELEDRIGTARRIGHKVRELGFMHLSARFLAKHGKYREAFAALQDWHQAQAEYARQTAESKLESLSIRYELAEARSKAELERIRNEELAKALNSSRELQKQKDYFMAIVAPLIRRANTFGYSKAR